MNIGGKLSQLLNGLPYTDELLMSLIGKPINDSNGKKIGTITNIDIKEDIWYGRLEENERVPEFLDKRFNMSTSMKIC